MKKGRAAILICAALILSGCAEKTEGATETRQVPIQTTSGAPVPVETEEAFVRETSGEDFETAEENGGIVIVRYTGEAANVVIPAEIGGKAVVGIGEKAFYENRTLESVVIPDSVASIESFAFMCCENLENVVFPNRAVEMGRNIFSGNIIDAESPDPCPWICKMREENPLVIVNGNLLDALECGGEIVVPDGVLSICPSAFSELGLNMRPTGVRLPEGLKKIPAELFRGCGGMESVTIPESVTEIGKDAFYDCGGLGQIVLPDGLEKIDGSIFSPFDRCEVIYRGETYSSDRYEELYALFGAG